MSARPSSILGIMDPKGALISFHLFGGQRPTAVSLADLGAGVDGCWLANQLILARDASMVSDGCLTLYCCPPLGDLCQ